MSFEKMFAPVEGVTDWGDDELRGKRLAKWRPSQAGKLYRIKVLSAPLKRTRHFSKSVGAVKCLGPGKVCCKQLGDPENKVGVVIFVYEVDHKGQPIRGQDGQFVMPDGKGVQIMVLSEDLFAQFSSMSETAAAETEGRKSIKTVDIFLKAKDAHAVQYSKWEIQLTEGCLLSTWLKNAKTESNPEGSAEITKQWGEIQKACKSLWSRLPSEIGREVSEADLLAKLNESVGAPAMGDLPDMDAASELGDPTAGLLDNI